MKSLIFIAYLLATSVCSAEFSKDITKSFFGTYSTSCEDRSSLNIVFTESKITINNKQYQVSLKPIDSMLSTYGGNPPMDFHSSVLAESYDRNFSYKLDLFGDTNNKWLFFETFESDSKLLNIKKGEHKLNLCLNETASSSGIKPSIPVSSNFSNKVNVANLGASSITVSKIPLTYYGAWSRSCTFALKQIKEAGPEMPLRISANGYSVSEISCKIKSTSERNGEFIGKFLCSIDGEDSVSIERWKLFSGKLQISKEGNNKWSKPLNYCNIKK